jgi:hypothetical protein
MQTGHAAHDIADGRRSTKVHAPPGGASSFSLAHDDGSSFNKPQRRDPNAGTFSFGGEAEPAPARAPRAAAPEIDAPVVSSPQTS